jgi:hypothetical protein
MKYELFIEMPSVSLNDDLNSFVLKLIDVEDFFCIEFDDISSISLSGNCNGKFINGIVEVNKDFAIIVIEVF